MSPEPDDTPAVDSSEPEPVAPTDFSAVRARTAQLFDQLLGEAEHILKAGSTQNKIALMKSVIPVLMRELQAADASAQQAAQQQAFLTLFAQVRGEISGFTDDLMDD